MIARFGETRITLLEGDITHQDADAIVNAANTRLIGGSGVDGAIHRAGGPSIMQECKEIIRRITSLNTGEAVLTTGGNLHARYVIHTVGPFWHGGQHGEVELLANAYRNSLTLAQKHGLKTVAFPSISTGVYRFPMDQAARVALGAIREFCEANPGLEEVRMVLFGAEALKIYQAALKDMPAGGNEAVGV